ncbi:MAG TPA: vitamin K epoxide reductase family protein [Herpetosiphonaceae bacterium]
MQARILYARMIAALLALLGLLDAAYLTLNRYQHNIALVCPVGAGCEAVQASRWSTLPPGGGLPVSVIGMAGYGLLLALALAGLHRERLGPLSIATALLALAGGGLLLSNYFMALQLFVIRALCFWCIISALLELGIFGAALYGWIVQKERRSQLTVHSPPFKELET